MTLWLLLTSIIFLSSVFAGAIAGHRAGGIGGSVAGSVLGIVVGLLCALGWLRILARIAKGFDSERPKWRDELIVIAWYLGALIWAFLGAGFVIWGVTILARLLTTA